MQRSGNPAVAGDAGRRLLALRLRELAAERVTPAGHAYRSPAEFVLRHGRWVTPRRRAQMTPDRCYANAIMVALVYGWTYVEGYALTPPVAARPLELEQHAWVVDRFGVVWELTWPLPGVAYVGVRFSVERADDWEGDETVLDDRQRGWPLLRRRWHGEPLVPPARSERLQILGTLYADALPQLAGWGLPRPPQVDRLGVAEHERLRARLAELMARETGRKVAAL